MATGELPQPGMPELARLLDAAKFAQEALVPVGALADWFEQHARGLRDEAAGRATNAIRLAGEILITSNEAGELSVAEAAAAVTRLQLLDPARRLKLEPGFDIASRVSLLQEGTPVIGLGRKSNGQTGIVEAQPSSLTIHRSKGPNHRGPVAEAPGYVSPSAELALDFAAVEGSGVVFVAKKKISLPHGLIWTLIGADEIQAAANNAELKLRPPDELPEGDDATNVGDIRRLRLGIARLAVVGVEFDTTHIDGVLAEAEHLPTRDKLIRKFYPGVPGASEY